MTKRSGQKPVCATDMTHKEYTLTKPSLIRSVSDAS